MSAGRLAASVHVSPDACPLQLTPEMNTIVPGVALPGVRIKVPVACTGFGIVIVVIATASAENSKITATRDLNFRDNMEHASLCGV